MAYLLAVSFLLHFVSFFALIVLVQKINVKNYKTGDEEKLKREIEDLLVAYTTEMKDENEKLVNKIIHKRKDIEQTQTRTIKSYENNQGYKNKPQDNKYIPVQKEVFDDDTYAPPPTIEKTEDIIEQSSTAQILSLAKQGYSAKEIAKKLNIGDGEVELLLKFHK